jgi:hypothetical protein
MQIQKINKCNRPVKMELKMRNTIPSAFIPDIMSWKMNCKVMEDELQGLLPSLLVNYNINNLANH